MLAVVLAVTQTRAADDLKHKQAETLEALVLANQRLDQLNRANSVLISIFKDLDARGSTRQNRTLEAALGERLVEAGKRLGDDAAGDPLAAADLQDALGTTLSELGYPRDAVPLHGKSSAVRERVLGPQHPKTIDAINNLAIDYILSDQFALAAPLLEQLVERIKAVYGADHENTLDALNNLAVTYRDSGNPEKARPIHEEILAKVTVKFGPDDERTHSTMHNLASVFQDLKLLDRAIPLYQTALDGRTARFGADHPTVLQNKKNLAMALLENGDLGKAGEFLGDVVQRLTKRRGPDHPETLIAASVYGEALLRQKLYAEAERVLRDCLNRSEKKAPDAWTTFQVQTLLGAAVLGQGRYDDAEPFLLAGQKGLAESMKTHANLVRPRLRDAASRLVELYEAWGKPAEAARWRDAARAP